MFTKNKGIHTESVIIFHKHQSSKVILESTQSCLERKEKPRNKFPEMTKIKSFDMSTEKKKYFELRNEAMKKKLSFITAHLSI